MGISAILKLLNTVRVGFGIACLCMSLIIIYSMFINNLDRFYHSNCGFTCGYLMDVNPKYFNPLDSILQLLSARHESFYNIQLFLDTIFFVIILMYTFICILYGLVKIGINFLGL